MPSLKITSDGTAYNTKVFDIKTGKMLGKVQKVTWVADINEPLSKCIIELIGVPLEIDQTQVNEVVYKNSQEVKINKKDLFKEIFNLLEKYSKLDKKDEPTDNSEFIQEALKIKEQIEKENETKKESKVDGNQA